MAYSPKLGTELLYLSRRDVESLNFSMAETMAAVETALQEKGRGQTQMPPKPGLHPKGDAFIHAMPAYVPSMKAAGIKWVSGFPTNQSIGLPYISGLLVLNDPETGMPLAVMDATWITAQRTGAVSGVTAKYLAPPGARTLAILGCGVQARTQLDALQLALPDLKEVRCHDLVAAAAARFIHEMAPRFPHLNLVQVDTARDAVVGADVVMTAGPILKQPNPVIKPEWVKEGFLGLPIDFDSMWDMATWNAGDKFYVDDRAQFEYYKTLGFFGGHPAVVGDLGELTTGQVPARESAGERIIACNLGLAIEDMATAVRLYQRALELEIGHILPL